jgi:transposase
MRIIYERVAGLDVHKKTVVACRMRVTAEQRLEWETKTFGTMTADLLGLHDWLSEWECTHLSMESTADYWKPVYNLLEGDFEVLLVNAQHVKKVPGRKTDATDAEWLAELMLHGLLKASFIPAKPQRVLRELTRYRTTLVRERARVVNRVEKLLESTNIKLSSVVTDVMGVSARAMLQELARGSQDPQALAELAKGRLRSKLKELQAALVGVVEPHHRFILAQQLGHIDFLDEQIEAMSAEIGAQLERMSQPPTSEGSAKLDEPGQLDSAPEISPPPLTWSEAVALLDTMPGVDERVAEVMLAEMGLEMSQFPTAKELVSWAGLAPGNHQSGGKRYASHTTKGNNPLRSIMTQAAWAASRTKDSFLKARYHRLAARRGKKRAIVALAHSMLVSAWHMLTRRQTYQELGGDYYDQRKKETKVTYLTQQLARLGFAVTLDPVAVPAA